MSACHGCTAIESQPFEIPKPLVLVFPDASTSVIFLAASRISAQVAGGLVYPALASMALL